MIRRSLLLGMLTLTAVVLLVAAGTAVLALRGYLLARTDDQLDVAARFAQQRIGQLDDAMPGTLQGVIAPSDYLVERRRADGTLTRVGSLQAMPGRPLLDNAPAAPADGSLSRPVNLGDGLFRAVVVRTADGATILVALPMAPVRQTIRQLALVELVVGVAVLLVLAAGGRWLVGRSLRPLDRITATATAIAAGSLDHRVPGPSRPDTEVGRLTLAVNGMLARIAAALRAREASEERMRRFVADASHELRTPLTSIRGYLQLLRQGMVPPGERPDVLRRTDEEARRMAGLVDDLLYLTRLDAEPALRHTPFDLVPVVRDAVSDLLAVQPRPARLEMPQMCPVVGDADSIRQVMANLLANVRVHTPPETSVTVRLRAVHAVAGRAMGGGTSQGRAVDGWAGNGRAEDGWAGNGRAEDGWAGNGRAEDGAGDRCVAGGLAAGGWAEVEVRDDGPGMPADLAARAFDRFTRGDSGRGVGGSGLGLSIVAEIVRAGGGVISLESAPGDGTTVRFTVPLVVLPADS